MREKVWNKGIILFTTGGLGGGERLNPTPSHHFFREPLYQFGEGEANVTPKK